MLKEIIASIKPLDTDAMEGCQLRLDNLTKPLGSLHSFEHLACQIAGITRNPRPRILQKSIIRVGSDDDKVAINVFAEHVFARLVLIDSELFSNVTGPRQQIVKAIELGIKTAQSEIQKGTQIIGISPVNGTNKISCLALFRETLELNEPKENDLLELLSKAGGIEVAALVGVILGAASGGAGVVIDGFISSVAALIAVNMAPTVKDYLVSSHLSQEPLHKLVLERIGLSAHLYLDLEIECGIGAALGMSLINASLHVLNDMKTFGEADVAVAQDGPGALKQNKHVRD